MKRGITTWPYGHQPRNPGALQHIQRTRHTFAAVVQHMGVNHRRRHIFVGKQFLNGANVIAALQQMRRERMPIMSSGT